MPMLNKFGYTQLMLKNSGAKGVVSTSRMKTLDRVYIAGSWHYSLVQHLLRGADVPPGVVNLGAAPASAADKLPLQAEAAAEQNTAGASV